MPVKLPTIKDPSDQTMNEIRRAFKQLDDVWLGRKEVQASLVAGTPTSVKHGLSYIPQHWLLSDKTALSDVWRVRSTSDSVVFDCSVNVDVTIIFW
jgi:hypothetical protein